LESQVTFEVHGDFSDEPEEGCSRNQEVGGLLIPSDFSQGNCSRAVAMGSLDATSSRTYPPELSPASEAWGHFTGVNGWAADQANARCFSSHCFSCCLLCSCSCHWYALLFQSPIIFYFRRTDIGAARTLPWRSELQRSDWRWSGGTDRTYMSL
jgi:hypothetical protein